MLAYGRVALTRTTASGLCFGLPRYVHPNSAALEVRRKPALLLAVSYSYSRWRPMSVGGKIGKVAAMTEYLTEEECMEIASRNTRALSASIRTAYIEAFQGLWDATGTAIDDASVVLTRRGK